MGERKWVWHLDKFLARSCDSITQHGGLDEAAFAKLVGLLQYIDGDYHDAGTFEMLRQALGQSQCPAHYLAIPPSAFATVVEGLQRSGASKNARVIIEKPFGRDLASAQQVDAPLHGVFPPSA